MIDSSDIKFRFQHLFPIDEVLKITDDGTIPVKEIREQFKELAISVYNAISDEQARELSLIITKLEEAAMWFNAAIARNE